MRRRDTAARPDTVRLREGVTRRYAAVIGEALIDLLETEGDGQLVYLPAVGGAPLNVAVGIARLGCRAEFLGSVGSDTLGGRIRAFLRDAGVCDAGMVDVDAPTTLAVTSFAGAEPDFHFYGEPRSYGLLTPDRVDAEVVAGAAVLYCGSIALLCDPVLAAARRAWAVNGPVRVFDPNVRPSLLPDPRRLRGIVEEFSATADVVKLSAADALALYDETPRRAADRLSSAGAKAVVVTLGAHGALVVHGGRESAVPGVRARAVDTTGAGDAAMAGLIYGILSDPRGAPTDLAGWVELTGFAMRVAALACEASGGATAMPTLRQVRHRFDSAG